VEIVRHLFHVQHAHRLVAHVAIERVAQLERVPRLGEVDMRHLRQRMHAGIGAAGAIDH